jgi:hypothetical protein
MPDPKCLDLAFSQVQDGVSLACMSDSMLLDLAISQVEDEVRQAQDSVSLTCMPHPIHLDLAMCQAQDSMGLANMLDLKSLNFAVNQVHDNYQGAWIWQVAKFKAFRLGSAPSPRWREFGTHVRPNTLELGN